MAQEQDVATIARQVSWLGLAAIAIGVLVALVGGGPLGVVLAVVGVMLYLAAQYLAARYR